MTIEAITCPHCRGSKVNHVHVDGRRNGRRAGWEQTITCWTCDGAGSISAEHVALMARGRRLRDARVKRRETVRDVARRLGNEGLAELLTRVEAGRLDAWAAWQRRGLPLPEEG